MSESTERNSHTLPARITELNELVQRILEVAGEKISVPVLFTPQLRAGQVELASDLFLRRAVTTRRDPQTMATECLPLLIRALPGRWSAERGYLNLVLSEAQVRSICAEPANCSGGGRVLIAVASGDKPYAPASLVRMRAMALVQALLRLHGEPQAPVSLLVDSELRTFESADSFWETAGELLFSDSPAPSKKRLFEQVRQKLTESSELRVTVWCEPQSLSSRDWKELSTIPAFFDRCRLSFLNRNQLLNLDPLPLPTQEKLGSGLSLAPALFYLASNRDGFEIDWSLPMLQERDNILWYAASLDRRLESLDIKSKRGSSNSQCGPRDIEQLALLHPLFFTLAGSAGELSRYLAALESLVWQTSAWVNSPQVRSEFHAGKGPEKRELLSSVREVLSHIIRLTPLTSQNVSQGKKGPSGEPCMTDSSLERKIP